MTVRRNKVRNHPDVQVMMETVGIKNIVRVTRARSPLGSSRGGLIFGV